MKYTQTEGFKKYCKDDMLSEAWMDGSDFGRFPEGWNGKYAVILNDMGVKKKK